MKCKKCDNRGWFFTPGTKAYGAKYCDCGAVPSAAGRVQVETRGDGDREEDPEIFSKRGLTIAEVLYRYGTVDMIEKYITDVEKRGFNDGLDAACKESKDNWDATVEFCNALQEMRKTL